MKEKTFTREGKIGLATIVCLLLLFFGFNYLKGVNVLKPSNYYYAKVSNVSGLVVSTPLFVNGYNVGTVRDISFNSYKPGEIIIELGMNADYKLPKGAIAHISTELMGTALVNLEIDNDSREFLNPGDTIMAIREYSLMEKASVEILPQLQQTLPRIDSVLQALQKVLENPALANSLTSIESTSQQLSLASIQLNLLLRKDIPVLLGNVNDVALNMETLTGNLKQIDFHKTMGEVDGLLSSLHSVSDKLNSKDNSLGLLLNDRELYDNLCLTSRSANDLLINLREHPKRYVHFSLFGRKDK